MTPFSDCLLRFGAQNRLFFRIPCCYCGGGILLLVTILFNENLRAQTLIDYQLPCGAVRIKIVPALYNGGTGDQTPCYPCCSPTNCQRVRYDIYLEALPPQPGSWNNGNFDFKYSHLVVKVNLKLVTGNLSVINEPYTKAVNCQASYFQNNPAVTFDAKAVEGEVTLLVTNMTGEVTPNIPFSNYVSTEPLFQVFVDGFPEEEFGLDCAELSYINDFFICENQPGCSGNTTSVFPYPSNSSSTVLSLSADCNSHPLYMLVPVTVSMLPANVSFMDFAIEISCTGPADPQLNAPPQVSGFNSNIPTPLITMKEIVDDVNYLIHARYSSFSASGLPSSDVLFVIRIPKPVDLGETYTITTTLKPGRIRNGQDIVSGTQSYECKKFFHSSGSVQCSNTGLPLCQDMWFTIEPVPTPPTECGKLSVYAKLNWNFGAGGQTRDFESFKALLEFDLQPGVSIMGAEVENMNCPTTFPCPDGCISNSSNTVSLCFVTSNGVTIDQNSRIRIDFSGDGGCVTSGKARSVSVKRKDTPNEQYTECRPSLYNMDQLCPNKIEGDIAMENGCYIEEVAVQISAAQGGSCNTLNFTANQYNVPTSSCAVPYSKCMCSGHNHYTVTPTKDGNDLNGVSTFDLVLINKQILGLELLNSPYKILAADANMSKSVTTFDIVELRKLILGIYSEIPNNTSWRFVPKNHVFLDPADPWKISNDPLIPKEEPPASEIFQLPTTTADFVAIKVGDVNMSALTACIENDCNAFQKPAGEVAFSIPQKGLQAGEYYTLPVKASDAVPLVAWQMALRFDPESLELIGPSQGDLPGLNAGNFGLTQVSEGIIRALWFAQPGEEGPLQPGQTLFYLTFRAKQNIADLDALLNADEATLSCLGWRDEGTAYSLRMTPAPEADTREQPANNPMSALCRPNPTSGEANFDLDMPENGKVRLSVYGAFGTRIFFREYSLEKGAHTLTVPEGKDWPAGVYHWELQVGKQRAKGRLIHQ